LTFGNLLKVIRVYKFYPENRSSVFQDLMKPKKNPALRERPLGAGYLDEGVSVLAKMEGKARLTQQRRKANIVPESTGFKFFRI
jgi:hypothetical protein